MSNSFNSWLLSVLAPVARLSQPVALVTLVSPVCRDTRDSRDKGRAVFSLISCCCPASCGIRDDPLDAPLRGVYVKFPKIHEGGEKFHRLRE